MRPNGQAQISVLPAVRGFFYLFIGRLPYRFLGLIIFVVSVSMVFALAQSNNPIMGTGFSRISAPNLPISLQTSKSPQAAKISDTQLLESVGLVKTPNGFAPYSKKMTVFSTSYDKNCAGCSKTTATGLPTGFGVVAVDPKVIPLGTKLYIPGYGEAVAGDTGGNIKGAKIDLGFDSVKNGWWSSRFVEIYILR